MYTTSHRGLGGILVFETHTSVQVTQHWSKAVCCLPFHVGTRTPTLWVSIAEAICLSWLGLGARGLGPKAGGCAASSLACPANVLL
jgi:hypothetical protein